MSSHFLLTTIILLSTIGTNSLSDEHSLLGDVKALFVGRLPLSRQEIEIEKIGLRQYVETSYKKPEEDNFECIKKGRYADLSDKSCKKYFLCSLLRNGTYIKTPYSCLGSMFNPDLHQCSKNYECPCKPYTTLSSTDTTTSSSCVSPSPGYEFDCVANGRFADIYDMSCTSYFLCTKLRNGTFIKTPYKCLGSIFNPHLHQCSKTYECSCKPYTTLSSTEVTSVVACQTPSPGYEFECTANGRYADLYDTSCTSYFLCTKLRNGTFIKTPYRCLGSIFNPDLHKCSKTYDCPCKLPTTSHPTEVTTVPTCVTPSPGYEFQCKTNGRYADLYDMSCTDYFLCTKLRNGTFIKTPYSCPQSTFHPLLGKCAKHYICPCGGRYSGTEDGPTLTMEAISPIPTATRYIL